MADFVAARGWKVERGRLTLPTHLQRLRFPRLRCIDGAVLLLDPDTGALTPAPYGSRPQQPPLAAVTAA